MHQLTRDSSEGAVSVLDPSIQLAAAKKLHRLRESILQEQKGLACYVPAQGQAFSTSDQSEPLLPLVKKQLSQDKRKVLLLKGQGGTGKSTFAYELVRHCWEDVEWKEWKPGSPPPKVPVPLFIPLGSSQVDPKHLLSYLQNLPPPLESFTEKEIQILKTDYRWLWVVDGYDELPKSKRINLYDVNGLAKYKGQIQLVITTRFTEGSEKFDAGLFLPHSSGNGRLQWNEFLELYLAPFNEEQITVFLTQYLEKNKHRQEGLIWSEVSRYQREFAQIPELKNLISNPFLLLITTEVLPQIVTEIERGEEKEPLKRKMITQAKLYQSYMQQWFKRQADKAVLAQDFLEKPEKLLGKEATQLSISLSGNQLSSELLKLAYKRFCQNLAVHLQKEGLVGIQYPQALPHRGLLEDEEEHKEIVAQPTWVTLLFSIHEPDLERLLKGCPILRDTFNQYQFLHASLIDYFVMTVVVEQSLKGQKIPVEKENKYEPLPTQGLLDEDEEENYILQSHLPRNTLRLSADSLKEDAESSRILRQYYADLIERSKTDASVAVGAANAMSILNAAGENFSHRDYSDIRIPGADLSGGLFNQTVFARADLSRVSFRGAWLYQADFQSANLMQVQFGEEISLSLEGRIKCRAFSPQSGLLAVGYELSQMIRIYEVSRNEFKSVLQGHLDRVTVLTWDPTGTRLASASADCTVRIWDVGARKECFPKIEFIEEVRSLVWDGEGKRIVCLEKNSIAIFLVESGKLLARWQGGSEEIKAMAWNSQKDLIALGEHRVHLWDGESKDLMDFKGYFEKNIYLLSNFNPEEKQGIYRNGYIFSSSQQKLFFIDLEASSHELTISKPDFFKKIPESEMKDLKIDPVKPLQKQLSEQKMAIFEDAIRNNKGHHYERGSLQSLSWNNQGTRLAATNGETIVVWNRESGQELCRIASKGAGSLTWDPSGERLAGINEGIIDIWQVTTGKLIRQFFEAKGEGISISWDITGEYLISIGSTVRNWNTFEEKELRPLKTTALITAAAWEPQGSRIALGSMKGDIIIMDAQTGEELECVSLLRKKITTIQWSPSGKYQVALLGDRSYYDADCILIFDLTTKQLIKKFSNDIAFFAWYGNQDREHLAIGHWSKPIEIWDTQREEKIQEIALEDKKLDYYHPWACGPLAWNPQGTQLAALSTSWTSSSNVPDHDVVVWQLNRKRPFRELIGHEGGVSAVAWDREGKRLATGSGVSFGNRQYVIKVWDIFTGKSIHEFKGHKEWINSLVWDNTGFKLISGSQDATVRVWNLVTGECSLMLTFPRAVRQVFWQKGVIDSLLTVICDGLVACYQWNDKQNKPYLQWLNTPSPLLCLQEANVTSANLSPHTAQFLSQQNVVGAETPVVSLMSTAERQFYLGKEKHPADEDYLLGISYLRGYGMLIDAFKAYKYIERAAQRNHPRASYYLAWMHEHSSIYHPINRESAETLFERFFRLYHERFLANLTIKQAVAQLDAWSCFTLGSLYLMRGSNYKEYSYGYWPRMLKKGQEWYQAAIPLLKQAAEQKVLQAQFLLGLCHQWGMGTEEDSKEAVRYYQLAAGSGYASAQSSLAACYEKSIGVVTNLDQALFWYDQAAVQNEVWAQKRISVLRPNPLDEKIESVFKKHIQENSEKYVKRFHESLVPDGMGELDDFNLHQFVLYEHNILASWSVALRWLEERHPKIAEVVKFCAYLHFKHIEKYFLAKLVNMSFADLVTSSQLLYELDLLQARGSNENVFSLKIYPVIQFGIRQRELKQFTKEQLFKQRLRPLAQLCCIELQELLKLNDPQEQPYIKAFAHHLSTILNHLIEFLEHIEWTDPITMEAAIYTLNLFSWFDTGNLKTYYEKLSEKNCLTDAKSAQRAVFQRKRWDIGSLYVKKLSKELQDYYIDSLTKADKNEMKESFKIVRFTESIYEDEKRGEDKENYAILDQEKFFRERLSQSETITLAKQLKEDSDSETKRSAYYDLIEQSKVDETKAIVAANAITILNVAGENFSDKNFQGVRIPGADLSGGLLQQVKFNGADLRNVCLQNAWAPGASFQEAKMEGVIFNEEIKFEMLEDGQINWDLSPDGRTLAVLAIGVGDGFRTVIKLFDVITRRLRFWFGEDTLMKGEKIVWDKEGKRLAVGCDGPIIVWEARSGKKLQELKGHQKKVHDLSWHPYDDLLVSAGEDKTVRVWDLQRNLLLWEFKEHKREVMAVAWDPTGKQIASGSKDKQVFIIQADNGKPLQSRLFDSEVHALIWDPMSSRLAIGGKKIQIWNSAEQKELTVLEGKDRDRIWIYKRFLWDRDRLIACTTESIQVWNMTQGQLQSELALGYLGYEAGSIAYWSKEEKVAISNRSFSDKDCLHVIKLRHALRAETADPIRIRFLVSDPMGKQFALAGIHNTVLVFNSETLRERDLFGHLLPVTALAWDPQGKRLVSAGADLTVRLWDLEQDKELAWFTGHSSPVKSLSWNKHGDRLVSVSESNEVWLWDVNTQQCYAQMVMEDVEQVVWDSSGTRLIGCPKNYSNNFWMMDVVTGKLLVQFGKGLLNEIFNVHPYEEKMAVVSGYFERDIHIVNFKGQYLAKIAGAHHKKITCLLWGSEGEILLSGDEEGIVKIWHVTDKQCLFTLPFPYEITCLHWLASTEKSLLIVAFLNNLTCYALAKDHRSAKLLWKWDQGNWAFMKGANFKAATGLTAEDNHLLVEKGGIGLAALCQPMKPEEERFFLGEHPHPADQEYLQGVSYRRGFGVTIDEKQAVPSFQRAAQQGHVRAKYYLAYYCQDGLYIEKDEKLAEQYFGESFIGIRQQVEDKPDAWGYYILADLYENGRGVSKDAKQGQASYDLALPLIQVKAKQGVLQAQVWLGGLYEDGLGGVKKNEREALRWYSLAVVEEFAYAQTLIGNYYDRHPGFKKLNRAIYWYQRAAEKGENFAISRLKSLHEQPLEMKDHKEEILIEDALPSQALLLSPKNACLTSSWYRVFTHWLQRIQNPDYSLKLVSTLLNRSVESNIPQALILLALCYEQGLGIEKDEDQAMKYYDLALEKKDPSALLYFANKYEEMRELRSSVDKYLQYYRLSAQQGDAEAQVKLAIALIDEKKPDFAEAFFWFDFAAQQDDILGRLHAGVCYEYGFGVEVDAQAAFNHYQLAAKDNHVTALTILGFSFERGVGIGIDRLKAITYYKKAAGQGYWPAITRLHDLGEEYKFDPNRVWVFGKDDICSPLLETMIGEILFGLNPQKVLPEKLVTIPDYFSKRLQLFALKGENRNITSHWFRVSASLGDSFSQAELGLRYELGGCGLLQDSKQAVHWYRLAAQQGDPRGQYLLANCYARGFGIVKDHHQALSFYKKAASQGHEEAKKEIKKLRESIVTSESMTLLVSQAVLYGRNLRQTFYEAMAIDGSDDMNDPNIVIGLRAIEAAERSAQMAEDRMLMQHSFSSSPHSTPQVIAGESKLPASNPLGGGADFKAVRKCRCG